MSLPVIVLVVTGFVVALIGALPHTQWHFAGYVPSFVLSVLLLTFLVLVMMDRL